MKLSIIIALYNTEKYIEKCIRSIYLNNQLPLNEYEVIVINDGSSDRSREIVEKLLNECSNIILINKENGGQSSARNRGFAIAKGEYVFCLDSDDFVEASNLVDALGYCFDKNLDMLPIFFKRYTENNHLLPDKKDIYPIINTPISGGEFLNDFVVSGSMWRYFYKTSIIRENNLFLTEGIYHEDEEFIIKFLSYVQRIAYQRHLVYNHLIRLDSTVNKKDKAHRIKLLNDIVTVIKHLQLHKDNFKDSEQVYNGISKKIEQLSLSLFLRMKSDELNFEEVQQFVQQLKQLSLYPMKAKNLDFKFKMISLLFNTTLWNKMFYK